MQKNEKISVFILSDTHFSHDNIIKYTDRPFTAEEQNEKLVANWNATVRPQDLVIHCGDFCMHKGKESHDIIKRLNGRKILCRGNHDRKATHWYLTNGWDFICDSFTWGTIMFTHKPIEHLPHGISLNIHGHVHNKSSGHGAGWVNVSVEKISYRPIKLEKVLQRHLRRK